MRLIYVNLPAYSEILSHLLLRIRVNQRTFMENHHNFGQKYKGFPIFLSGDDYSRQFPFRSWGRDTRTGLH